jgi:hypothetical protein
LLYAHTTDCTPNLVILACDLAKDASIDMRFIEDISAKTCAITFFL